jgi:hypothetical protein
LQAARKCIDDGQEKLAAAAAERSTASAAKDKELWARDAELRRLQVKVEAAEAAAAARRAEAERMKELVDLREQEAQAAERSRVEASLSFDALMQTALQKQQLAHAEELRAMSRDRSRDAARLSEAEATILILRAEVAEEGKRVAAAEAAAQEAREGAEVLLQQVQSVHERAEIVSGRVRPQTADSDVQRRELRSGSSTHAPRHSTLTPVLQQQQQQQQQQQEQLQQPLRSFNRTPLHIDVSQDLLSPPTLPEYVATPPLPPPPHALRSVGTRRPKSANEDAGGPLVEENKRLRAAVQDMRLQVTPPHCNVFGSACAPLTLCCSSSLSSLSHNRWLAAVVCAFVASLLEPGKFV